MTEPEQEDAILPLRARQRLSTKREIESAALRVAEARGFSETTVEHIASAAGVSMRTFYRHCANKEEAILAEIIEGQRRFLAAVDAQPPAPVVDAICAAFVEATRTPRLHRVLQLVLRTPALRGAWLAITRDTQDALEELLEVRYAPSTDRLARRASAAAVIAVLNIVLEEWAQQREADLEVLTRSALMSALGHS